MSETPDERYVAEMSSAIERIWEIARKEGLDPFATNFELVPATIMYEFGAYGLPGRFSHWTRALPFTNQVAQPRARIATHRLVATTRRRHDKSPLP